MPVARGYPGSDAWRRKEEGKARAEEYELLGRVVESLFGHRPDSLHVENRWIALLSEFTPETRRIVGRVADLLGPAGKEALQALIEGVRDDTEERIRDDWEDGY